MLAHTSRNFERQIRHKRCATDAERPETLEPLRVCKSSVGVEHFLDGHAVRVCCSIELRASSSLRLGKRVPESCSLTRTCIGDDVQHEYCSSRTGQVQYIRKQVKVLAPMVSEG